MKSRPEGGAAPLAGVYRGAPWRSVGSSMLPAVLPGSLLHLRVRERGELVVQVQDIVCYLGSHDRIVAHRVVGVQRSDGRRMYQVKGDAQRWTEQVGEEAVLAVVTRVEFRGLSYRTDGPIGAALAAAALRTPWLVGGAAKLTQTLFWVRRALLKSRAAGFFRRGGGD